MTTAKNPRHGKVIYRNDFQTPWWLNNAHAQTIWCSVRQRTPARAYTHETVTLADGDFVELAWNKVNSSRWVLLLHGLEGSIDSSYIRACLFQLEQLGVSGVLMHFRGCGQSINRHDRSYHSGETGDLNDVVGQLSKRLGTPPLAVIGYSLGGNVLLKWLAECAAAAPTSTAIAVSVPFDLAACADFLNLGFARIYQRRLVRSMQQKYLRKFATRPSPLLIKDVTNYATFRSYDNAVIAPLHGFRDADDYYQQSSSRQFLAAIDVPSLIIHAADDPFVPAAAIPGARELSPATTLEVTPAGGHVGFYSRNPPTAWLEARIAEHLKQWL